MFSWLFKKRNIPAPKPRYVISVDGYGKYRVTAGPGYAPDIDDMAWMAVSLWFKDPVYANIEQAEAGIAEFEKHQTMKHRKPAKEIF